MRKILEIAKFAASMGSHPTVGLHYPSPDVLAMARYLADAVPGCWGAYGGDRVDGWITVTFQLSEVPHVTAEVAIHGVRRPLAWTNQGHLVRLQAQKAAGDLVLALVASEDSAQAVVLTPIDDDATAPADRERRRRRTAETIPPPPVNGRAIAS